MIFKTFDDILSSGIKYQVLYIDFPWDYKAKKPTQVYRPCLEKDGYSAINPEHLHYPTMSFKEIRSIPLKKIMDKKCAVFQWCTAPLMPSQLGVMLHNKIKYRGRITWIKTNSKQAGYDFKGMTEDLVYGRVGKIDALRSSVKNIQYAPITGHSEKPDLFRDIIDQVTSQQNLFPKLEMFARKTVNGWDQFGDQVKQVTQLEAFV